MKNLDRIFLLAVGVMVASICITIVL